MFFCESNVYVYVMAVFRAAIYRIPSYKCIISFNERIISVSSTPFQMWQLGLGFSSPPFQNFCCNSLLHRVEVEERVTSLQRRLCSLMNCCPCAGRRWRTSPCRWVKRCRLGECGQIRRPCAVSRQGRWRLHHWISCAAPWSDHSLLIRFIGYGWVWCRRYLGQIRLARLRDQPLRKDPDKLIDGVDPYGK